MNEDGHRAMVVSDDVLRPKARLDAIADFIRTTPSPETRLPKPFCNSAADKPCEGSGKTLKPRSRFPIEKTPKDKAMRNLRKVCVTGMSNPATDIQHVR
jgi:hypothetical protein